MEYFKKWTVFNIYFPCKLKLKILIYKNKKKNCK